MTCANAFFRIDDPRVDEIAGHKLLPAWWSRAYEYPWGLQFARPGDIVMDAGCGHNFRPFKDALAQIVDQVYAVDADREVLQQTPAPKMSLVWADFTQRIPLIGYEELDRVFCISVLEDLEKGDLIEPALREFARVLKPDGKMILTFDVPYDTGKECKFYPGLDLEGFIQTAAAAGLHFEGEIDRDKTNAVFHSDFNLAVWHCVLVKV
ncbi:MAG: class I SAM-dependent methyltransferase [Anaerolineae bacterium]|nr:class I SAM-dependent methyltransferase [Anaerolineae bacterium]